VARACCLKGNMCTELQAFTVCGSSSLSTQRASSKSSFARYKHGTEQELHASIVINSLHALLSTTFSTAPICGGMTEGVIMPLAHICISCTLCVHSLQPSGYTAGLITGNPPLVFPCMLNHTPPYSRDPTLSLGCALVQRRGHEVLHSFNFIDSLA